jgi:hypothetical protein
MLKKGTGELLSETISNEPYYNKLEEVFNHLIPKDFSSKNTFLLIMICRVIGSNNRYDLDS